MPKIQSNPNPEHGEIVASKDITINDEKKTWVRIYCPTKLPSNDGCVARLPMMIYFHSGGWIDHSVEDLFYHERCTQFSRDLPAIIISLEYRLAPEYRLPTQYEDAIDVILWVRQQMVDPKGEQWLKDYGDFSRCYLGGRGNGANMAYNASLRALDVDIKPLTISGLILNQPMFGGNQRTKSELKYACDELYPLPVWDLMWELALPKGADRDHKFCNPMKDYETQQNKLSKLTKCLLFGYSMDPMVDRQQEFVAMMVGCGAKIEAHFDVGFHGVDLVDSKRGSYNLQLVKEFVQ
ncbi:putative carboxylesterase 9 [Bienertia sinuspersici]